ncbi:MAG: hypothetical protein Q9170_007455 [Blastenia crenularia]
MVRIAIAGGTGGLGRTLVDELCKGGEHTTFVLSRKSQLPFEVSSNVHCLATDYGNLQGLRGLLDSNNIHTVISTLNPPTPEVHTSQNNLIQASAESRTVKRFIPSEWGIDYFSDDEHVPLPWKILKRQSISQLKKYPNLEYTMVYNGYFMDYFGMPHCQSHMLPEIPYIDIAAAKAAIPGTGDEKVSLTYTKDVAKLVRKLVESEERWPVQTLIAGDVVTFNGILEAAEQARGIKFDVVHDSLQDLRQGKVTEIPAYGPMYEVFSKEVFLEMTAAFAVAMVTGVFVFDGKHFNEQYPEIRMTKLRDFIMTHWSGKH